MLVDAHAPGRLSGAPVAIVDIGSNSVRLVAYEACSRAPTPILNEKVLCGLGRGVATTGLLSEDAVDKALAALRCFRSMCRTMGIVQTFVIATAATREARNGAAFLERARTAVGTSITLIDGAREAELSARGVIAGSWRPDGLVGDLGGGSLELVDVSGTTIGPGVSMPIGGLSLSDLSKGSPRRAVRIVREALDQRPALLAGLQGRTFYAVGGTWRALAKLHMQQRRYPLRVMHGYSLPADDPEFLNGLVEGIEGENPPGLGSVSASRRPLLGFGAVVLAEIIRAGRPGAVVISTCGVREGLLFEQLPAEASATDPLLLAARELNLLRSRSPAHADELTTWLDTMFATCAISETPDERRLRHAACLISDLGWRAHPDYRGAAVVGTVANASFIGIDHAGRCFLAAAINHRYEGPDGDLGTGWRSLLSPALEYRAKLVGVAMRVAFQLSSATAGVLPRTRLEGSNGILALTLPGDLSDLASARLHNRLRQAGRLLERESAVRFRN